MNFSANNTACVLIAAAIIAVTSFWPEIPTHAAQQQPVACGPHNEVVKSLGKKFHEASSAVALTSAGTLLEVLRTDDGATWTIIVTRPDGLSCVVAAGRDWQDRAPGAPTSGDGGSSIIDPKKGLDISF